MLYTLKQIKDSLPISKNSVSSFWVRLWVRRFSFLLTYIFLNLKISANAVSIISAIIAGIGCVLLSINNVTSMILGVIFINLWIVFDCVDGNIARCLKTSSYVGEFFDAVSGYVICAFAFLSVGIAAYHTTDMLGNYKYIFIILGALGSISDIFARLIYQKFTCTCLMISQKGGNISNYTPENENFEKVEKPTGFTYFRLVFDRQTGISSLFMPLLILSLIFNLFDYVTVFYSLYHIAALLWIFVSYLIKANKLYA